MGDYEIGADTMGNGGTCNSSCNSSVANDFAAYMQRHKQNMCNHVYAIAVAVAVGVTVTVQAVTFYFQVQVVGFNVA